MLETSPDRSGRAALTRSGLVELDPVGAASRMARRWAVAQLAYFEPVPSADLADAVVLLVSELVTNAITALNSANGRALPEEMQVIVLSIAQSARTILIEVRDNASDSIGRRRANTDDSESGRGLMVVAALSTRWGWFRVSNGKAVWCEVTEASASRSID